MDSFSTYHIDSIINGCSENAWRHIGFYGELDRSKDDGWNMLHMLSSKRKLPWCCFEDFNELLKVKDKKGGVPRTHNLMQSFRDVLDQCSFVDLGFTRPDYTWYGRRWGELIWERLDKGVANYECLARFPTNRVKHLNCFTSNPQPIILSLAANGEQQRWRQKPFRFKAMWTLNSACREAIFKAWDCTTEGTPMFKATRKLQRCKKSLKAWNRDHFGNVQRNIKQVKDRLWRVEEVSTRSRDYGQVAKLKSELNALYDKEE